MAASESETETSIHTELSAGDALRESYRPYRVGGDNPEVHAFRRWWLNNPINNLWTKKPNQWATFQKVQAGKPIEEAVRGGAHVQLEDITQRGPTQEEILADGDFELSELPSDEAWFGTPDPTIYAQGTNHLDKQQLAEEVAKGNVVTLHQLKQHLATATPEQLKMWEQVLAVQHLKERAFIDLPDDQGRVSVWDLMTYVRNNPELKALVDKDPNMVLPKEGMTKEERIRILTELAPWKLCGNERHMVLPPEVSAQLGWGLLAAGSWYSRRPTRWLKGLDGVKDFDYGVYVHEEAAQGALGDSWGGRAPNEVLSNKAFYKDAVSMAPKMGMTLLAVASRPLPLEEVTQAWEQRMQQQIDRLEAASSGSGKVLLSTAASSASNSESGSYETTERSGSASEEEASSSSSSEVIVQQKAAAATQQQQRRPQQLAARESLQPQAAAPAQQQRQQQQQQQQQQQAPAVRQQVSAPPAAGHQPAEAAHSDVRSSTSQPVGTVVAPKQPAAAAQVATTSQQQQQQLRSEALHSDVPSSDGMSPGFDIEDKYLSLAMLRSLFDRDRLAADTELLDMRGTKLREGSTIIFSAHPAGSLLVQAISPGLVKDQKSYVLGSVYDPALTTALMSMFMDPDTTVDPEVTAAAGLSLLGVVNGYRVDGQKQSSTARALLSAEDAYETSKDLFTQAKWGLPDVGKAPKQAPLVKNVRREVMYHKIDEAFESAVRAAAAIEPPHDKDINDVNVQRSVVYARRRAAEAVLKQHLGALGLNVSGLTLPVADVPADLLSLSRPLAQEAAAETLSVWR